MCNKFKDIDLENCTDYFFDDMINIKSLFWIKSKQMKRHVKILLFITLGM